jgi:metallo-beta-lactamase class B
VKTSLLIVLITLISMGHALAGEPLSSDRQIDEALAAPLSDYEIRRQWNEPQTPFHIIGNIYYVGTRALSAFLITTPDGHILMDGGLKQSPPIIMENIAVLGFDTRDVRYLLNSHAHFDHAGGLAALKRASGAQMIASAKDKAMLESGENRFDGDAVVRFPAVRVDRVIGDKEIFEWGGATLTAHITPGHTAGCTSWSMQVQLPEEPAQTVLFHCSASVGGQSLVPETYPGQVADFQNTFKRFRQMNADILLVNHPFFFNMHEKLARREAGETNVFTDRAELARFTDEMESNFEEELRIQKSDQ